MKNAAPRMLTLLLITTGIFGGCEVSRAPVSLENQNNIRAAAVAFIDALRLADEDQLRASTYVAPEAAARELGEAVYGDVLLSRRVQTRLTEQFAYVETKPQVVGGDAWVESMRQTARQSPIVRVGDRARIGDKGTNNGVYVRRINGTWKVELIPTLVSEAGGKPTIDDPVVTYRFGVTRATNDWLLRRLDNGEFASRDAFESARKGFWIKYLMYAADGKDPHDMLLHTLPPMPVVSAADN